VNFDHKLKIEVSSHESEWIEKLVVVYINTNSESLLAGIAKLHLFFSYSCMVEYWHLYLSSHTNAESLLCGTKLCRMGGIIVRHAAMMSSAVGLAVLQ